MFYPSSFFSVIIRLVRSVLTAEYSFSALACGPPVSGTCHSRMLTHAAHRSGERRAVWTVLYYSNSALSTWSTWSTVSSSRSAFSTSISRGASSTFFAVLKPIDLMASITHWSISSANSSR